MMNISRFLFFISFSLVFSSSCRKDRVSPPSESVIAGGLFSATGMFQTATDIYVFTFDDTASSGGITRLSKADGRSLEIVKDTGALKGIFINEIDLYWVSSSSVLYKVPSEGNLPIEISREFVTGTIARGYFDLGIVHNEYIYTADMVSNGTISRLRLNGGTPEILVSNQSYPHSLLINNGVLYWANLPSTGIMKMSLEDLTVSKLATSVKPWALKQSDDFFYWYNDMSIERNNTQPRKFEISKMPITGGPTQTLISELDQEKGFEVRDHTIYWVTGNNLQSISIDGSDRKTLVSGLDDIKGLLVDESYVYFLNAGQLRKILR